MRIYIIIIELNSVKSAGRFFVGLAGAASGCTSKSVAPPPD